MAARPETLNHLGAVHAGALFALGESASGALLVGHFAKFVGRARVVVRTSQIQYLRAATGDVEALARAIEAIAALHERIETTGRCTFAAQVELRDRQGVTIATMQVEWDIRLNPPRD